MAKKISKQVAGGWIDESLPTRALNFIDTLSSEENLAGRIGDLVGEYRLSAEYRDTAPQPSESIRHAQKVQKAITDLLADLELMPEDVKALATDNLLKLTGDHYEQFTEHMSLDLLRYRAACGQTIETMQQWPSMKGEKPKYLEHKLLSAVSDLLEPYSSGLENTAELASKVLRLAGIKHMPVDRKKARAAILAYQRKSKTPR